MTDHLNTPNSPNAPGAPMTCAEFEDEALQDLLENTLGGQLRTRAESHLASCARCRSLVADLNDLRDEAARLPVLSPSHDLWDGIAARIETPVVSFGNRSPVRFWQRPAWLAAAAVVLMTATAGVTWTIARQAPAAAVESPSARVAAAYAPDIAQLTTLVAQRPPAIDSASAQVLASSMRTIDNAIARVRAALDAAPSNAALAQQLSRAYDMKLSTLRMIATMETE